MPRRIGVETLMLMAKYDSGFRKLLLDDREKALEESGLDLSPSERMIIQVIGRDQLEKNIDGFDLPGVTKKSLPNWRVAASVMVLISTILFGFESCLHQVAVDEKAVEQECNHGCWIDNDTYRLHAAAAPSKKLRDAEREERRKYSKRIAILNAQYQIIEKFKGIPLEAATGIMGSDPAAVGVAKDLKEAVKRGTVISESFDEEDNCEVLYEVKDKALKKKVQYAEWSY